MNRRAFVMATGGAMAAGAAGTMGLAAEKNKGPSPLRLGPSYVTNREQFAHIPDLAPGHRLSLRRRPDRRFDPESVEVVSESGAAIGFLPPASSAMLATMMDEGGSAFALVGDHPRQGQPLAVDVYFVLPAHA